MPYTADRLQATRAWSISCDYVRRQEHTNIAESPKWVVCERVRYTSAKTRLKNFVNHEFSRQLTTCLRSRRKPIQLAQQQSRHSGPSASGTAAPHATPVLPTLTRARAQPQWVVCQRM